VEWIVVIDEWGRYTHYRALLDVYEGLWNKVREKECEKGVRRQYILLSFEGKDLESCGALDNWNGYQRVRKVLQY
jgi:hypothetical protein